jgi:hypothetical protein
MTRKKYLHAFHVPWKSIRGPCCQEGLRQAEALLHSQGGPRISGPNPASCLKLLFLTLDLKHTMVLLSPQDDRAPAGRPKGPGACAVTANVPCVHGISWTMGKKKKKEWRVKGTVEIGQSDKSLLLAGWGLFSAFLDFHVFYNLSFSINISLILKISTWN